MSTHTNAELLLAWLRQRSDATVSDIVASGLMKARTASDAMQYALRSGAVERGVRRGASARDRVRYRATGVALPTPRTQPAQPCFAGLLTAWGMVLEPPRLASVDARRHTLADLA